MLHDSPPYLFKYVTISDVQIANLGCHSVASYMQLRAKVWDGKVVRVAS